MQHTMRVVQWVEHQFNNWRLAVRTCPFFQIYLKLNLNPMKKIIITFKEWPWMVAPAVLVFSEIVWAWYLMLEAFSRY